MELKAQLLKPYTEEQEIDFKAVQNQQLYYEIIETETALEAWGLSDEEQLQQAKDNKYQEANLKAREFLETGIATFELNENFHVEATKENMNSLMSASMAIEKGLIQTQIWTSKEDNVLELTKEQCTIIAFGIGEIQGDVWSRQFINYKNAIESASTIEEVLSIVIDYTQPIEGE